MANPEAARRLSHQKRKSLISVIDEKFEPTVNLKFHSHLPRLLTTYRSWELPPKINGSRVFFRKKESKFIKDDRWPSYQKINCRIGSMLEKRWSSARPEQEVKVVIAKSRNQSQGFGHFDGSGRGFSRDSRSRPPTSTSVGTASVVSLPSHCTPILGRIREHARPSTQPTGMHSLESDASFLHASITNSKSMSRPHSVQPLFRGGERCIPVLCSSALRHMVEERRKKLGASSGFPMDDNDEFGQKRREYSSSSLRTRTVSTAEETCPSLRSASQEGGPRGPFTYQAQNLPSIPRLWPETADLEWDTPLRFSIGDSPRRRKITSQSRTRCTHMQSRTCTPFRTHIRTDDRSRSPYRSSTQSVRSTAKMEGAMDTTERPKTPEGLRRSVSRVLRSILQMQDGKSTQLLQSERPGRKEQDSGAGGKIAKASTVRRRILQTTRMAGVLDIKKTSVEPDPPSSAESEAIEHHSLDDELEENKEFVPLDSISRYRQVFHEFDEDNSNTASFLELGRILMRIFHRAPSLQGIRWAFKEIQRERDDSVDFDEFLKLLAKYQEFEMMMQMEDEKAIENAFFDRHEVRNMFEDFKTYDKDGSGDIDMSEVIPLLQKLGREPKNKKEQNAMAMIMGELKASWKCSLDFPKFLQFTRRLMDENEVINFESEVKAATKLGYSTEERIELKEIFDSYDEKEEGTGEITFVTIKRIIKDLHIVLNLEQRNYLFQIVASYDTDGNSGISFAEFLSIFRTLMDENFVNINDKTAAIAAKNQEMIASRNRQIRLLQDIEKAASYGYS